MNELEHSSKQSFDQQALNHNYVSRQWPHLDNSPGHRWSANPYSTANRQRPYLIEILSYGIQALHTWTRDFPSSHYSTIAQSDRSETTPPSNTTYTGYSDVRRCLCRSGPAGSFESREDWNCNTNLGLQDLSEKSHTPTLAIENLIYKDSSSESHSGSCPCCLPEPYLKMWQQRRVKDSYSADSSKMIRSKVSIYIEATSVVVAALSAGIMYYLDEQIYHACDQRTNQMAALRPFSTNLLNRLPSSPATALMITMIPYCAAIGSHYYRHMGSKHHDGFLVCGTVIGIMVGWATSFRPEEIIIRLLPGVILTALLVHACYLRFC